MRPMRSAPHRGDGSDLDQAGRAKRDSIPVSAGNYREVELMGFYEKVKFHATNEIGAASSGRLRLRPSRTGKTRLDSSVSRQLSRGRAHGFLREGQVPCDQ